MLTPIVKIMKAKCAGKGTKRNNFTECEIEVLITEVAVRKKYLFGSLSSGIRKKRKMVE